MLEVLIIVGFLGILWCLGYSFLSLARIKLPWDELAVMPVGVGLAALPLLLWIVRLFFPIKWYVIFAVVLALFLLRQKYCCNISPKLQAPSSKPLLVIFIAAIHFAVFTYGAFQYSYLEDSDPLHHAVGAWQVARTGSTVSGRYLEPYPPFYDILMGLIVQLTGDAVITLKIVNALIVSLGILFAYYAVREFVGSSAAVWASFILAVLPSYLSHFIFAASWALTIFWPVLYLLGKTIHNPKIWPFLGIAASGIFLVQPISAAVFFLFYLLFIIFQKQKCHFLKALLLAIFLAGTYWGYELSVFGYSGIASHLGFNMVYAPGDTSEGKIYGIQDFILTTTNTRVDAPTGWGIMTTILLAASIFFQMPKWSTAWIIAGIILIEGNILPIHFWPHRMWQYAAIPVAIIAGISAHNVCLRFKKYKTVAILIAIGLVVSAGIPKLLINTNIWQRGPEWASYNEANGYSTLQKLGPGLRVFAPCAPDWKVISNNQIYVGKKVSAWNAPLILMQAKNQSADLIVFDESCVVQGFVDEKNLTNIINELLDSTIVVSQNAGFVAVSVNSTFTQN